MTFNRGYSCKSCGVMEKVAKKGQRTICPICSLPVVVWEKPLSERSGRCACCAGARFKSRIENHELVRTCQTCFEEYNIDTEKVVRKGVIDDEFRNDV